MRSFISLLAVAGLLLAASLLGAQQKGFDKEPKQKASDAETKPKDSEVKKKQKEQEEKAKKEFEKLKKDMASRYVYGRSLTDWINDLSNRDPSIVENAIKTIAANYGVSAGAAVPKLVPLLSDRDASIKVNTCIALGEIGFADQNEKTSQTAVNQLIRV